MRRGRRNHAKENPMPATPLHQFAPVFVVLWLIVMTAAGVVSSTKTK